MTTNAQAAVQAAATLAAGDISNGVAIQMHELYETAEEIKGWLDRQDAKQQTPDWEAEAHALERTHGIIGRPDLPPLPTIAELVRDHWPLPYEDPKYANSVRCMASDCEWTGRFPGDIGEHVAELIEETQRKARKRNQ